MRISDWSSDVCSSDLVSWAAGNGDRSENGDYLYGRKRLREIDRELNRLARRMKDAQVVDPRRQPDKSRIFFGATVTLVNEQDVEYIYPLVGAAEANTGRSAERCVGQA